VPGSRATKITSGASVGQPAEMHASASPLACAVRRERCAKASAPRPQVRSSNACSNLSRQRAPPSRPPSDAMPVGRRARCGRSSARSELRATRTRAPHCGATRALLSSPRSTAGRARLSSTARAPEVRDAIDGGDARWWSTAPAATIRARRPIRAAGPSCSPPFRATIVGGVASAPAAARDCLIGSADASPSRTVATSVTHDFAHRIRPRD
jgi:hypothetical protein